MRIVFAAMGLALLVNIPAPTRAGIVLEPEARAASGAVAKVEPGIRRAVPGIGAGYPSFIVPYVVVVQPTPMLTARLDRQIQRLHLQEMLARAHFWRKHD